MASTTKPTLIFVSGGLNDSSPWKPLRTALHAAPYSYKTAVAELPSIAPSSPLENFQPDVDAIRKLVTKHVENEDVVVVLHSYSGFPGSEALKGLGKEEREKEGKQGGVIRLVYIMSFMVDAGSELVPKGKRDGMPPIIVYDEKTRTNSIAPKDAQEHWYHDLPLSEAKYWSEQVKPQSMDVYWSTSTYAAWRDIPYTFVVCEEDKVVPKEYLGYMFELVKTAKGREAIEVKEGVKAKEGDDRIERVQAGHFPFLSKVNEMVGILRRAAGEEL